MFTTDIRGKRKSIVGNALTSTNFSFPNQTGVYHGKVRDVYSIGSDLLVMVASDRISAFDHILPKGIPHKGQVLNGVAAHFLRATANLVPNWLISTPDPVVAIGHRCTPYRVEMVIRGYLAGHAWREYEQGKRIICGVTMPDGMKQNDRFINPIITPATKADEGHDLDISREEIIAQGIVPEADYLKMEHYTRVLFEKGSVMAAYQGLILVDTKYEFGLGPDGQVMLMDEIHTPDSSRYFYSDGYDERQRLGQPQRQLSKEFVREWLMDQGFQGKEGQNMPVMPDDFVQTVSDRYIELYERVTGQHFQPAPTTEIRSRIERNVCQALTELGR